MEAHCRTRNAWCCKGQGPWSAPLQQRVLSPWGDERNGRDSPEPRKPEPSEKCGEKPWGNAIPKRLELGEDGRRRKR